MIDARANAQAMAAELQSVLDEEIELLAHKRSLLEKLSAAIGDRDEGAVEALLASFEAAQQRQDDAEARLSDVRDALADALGARAPGGKSRLSDLARKLPAPTAMALESRRGRLQAQVEALRQQHVRTALLLCESARVNRLMLDALMTSGGGQLTTYGRGGRNEWHGRSGVVDTAR